MLHDKAKRKISALLALSKNSGAAQPESESALALAKEIAARHGLSIDEIKPGGEVFSNAVQIIFQAKNRSLWMFSLACRIGEYTGVEIIKFQGKPTWSIIGRESDISIWKMLYERSSVEIENEGLAYSRGKGKSDGDTFRKAAATGFGERLAKYKQEAESSEQGKISRSVLAEGSFALVLIGREIEVARKVKQFHPNLKNLSVVSRGSGSAWKDGHRFGSGLGVHKANLM